MCLLNIKKALVLLKIKGQIWEIYLFYIIIKRPVYHFVSLIV